MRKLLLVAAATVGLGACTYPETKMTPVEPTASQTQTTEAPPADDTTTPKKPSAKR
jgi:hypothetical protein